MKNFNDSFTFDHTVCVVDNGDYGLAFNRFTGKVLAVHHSFGYASDGCTTSALLVDVEEYRRAYGEYPPNEELNTALDFGYWYRSQETGKVAYSPPERDYRNEILHDKLLTHFMPSVTDWASHDGIRDIEIRPWRHQAMDYTWPEAPRGIEECKPEDAEGWGLYGRTFSGPAWHMADVSSKEQAYWLRAALAPLLIVDRTQECNRFDAAWMRMEALADVKFDPEGR